MKKNIEVNTPRIIAGILIVMSIPQLYFIYRIIWYRNTDKEAIKDIRKSIDYLNLKGVFALSALFGLEVVRFSDRKASNRLPRTSRCYMLLAIPFCLQFTSLSYYDYVDKKGMIAQLVWYSSLIGV